jgi:hypothetical protein
LDVVITLTSDILGFPSSAVNRQLYILGNGPCFS